MKNTNQVNQALTELGKVYHSTLPIDQIDAILTAGGLRNLEEGIYCGHEGRVHEQVGDRNWFVMTWFRMPSGRFEVVAYVS
jgi:hypothetical protein